MNAVSLFDQNGSRNVPQVVSKTFTTNICLFPLHRLLIAFIAGVVLLMASTRVQAGDGCELFGEISVEAVKVGSTNVCILTKNPVACAIAAALATTAGDGLAKKGVTAGCEWSVEKSDQVLKVWLKSDSRHAVEAKKGQAELQKCPAYKVKEKK